MKIRAILAINRAKKYNIDNRFYESEMHVPEIIRDKNIISYKKIEGVMIIKTDESNRRYKQILQ